VRTISLLKTTRSLACASCLVIAALLSTACGSSSDLAADAGEDRSFAVGESPEFNGCSSSGEIVDYRWVIIDAPDGAADKDNGKVLRETNAECTFTIDAAMEVDEVGPWVIELTVSDSDGDTSTDSVIVTIEG
jgi:hypothetical protein